MGQIFDREFRREKNLITSKKLNKDAGAAKKDPSKVQAEKEEKMSEAIKDIEEQFFKKVSEDDDINAIMARGELKQQQDAVAD